MIPNRRVGIWPDSCWLPFWANVCPPSTAPLSIEPASPYRPFADFCVIYTPRPVNVYSSFGLYPFHFQVLNTRYFESTSRLSKRGTSSVCFEMRLNYAAECRLGSPPNPLGQESHAKSSIRHEFSIHHLSIYRSSKQQITPNLGSHGTTLQPHHNNIVSSQSEAQTIWKCLRSIVQLSYLQRTYLNVLHRHIASMISLGYCYI